MSLFQVILLTCVMTLMVTGHKSCSINAELMKSIQYQLKLVENNDGKCDCKGRYTGPEKVAFMVKNSADLLNIPANSVVVYNTVITNLGNGYDSSTGIFKAPSNCVYIFSWTVLCQHGKSFRTYLALNGHLIARNFAGARNVADHASGSQNVVIEVKKDDEIFVRIQDGYTGQFMYADSWSTFSGYKL
ncbi:complement C1q-like protein 2 [Mytilus californianus]|uniref:complement C1q-like protein 2 n=1 Tax=Mytilus californianus TaxID=6549 RepID=UPI002245B57E|nr:complement C1q-like protein 2 [Mytilus californianus]